MSFFDLSVTGTAPRLASRQPVVITRPPTKPPSYSIHPSKSPFFNRTTGLPGYYPQKPTGTAQHLMNYTNQLMGAAKEYSIQHKMKPVHVDKEIRLLNKPELTTQKQPDISTKQKKLVSTGKVKPYRGTRSRRAPQGVPKLNLSQLCEPDEEMMPIQLISSRKNSDAKISDSVRSWGSPESLRKEREGGQGGERRGRRGMEVKGEEKREKVAEVSKGDSLREEFGVQKKQPRVPLLDLTVLSSTRKESCDRLTDIENITPKSSSQAPTNPSYNPCADPPPPKLTTAWGEGRPAPQVESRKLDRMTEEVLDKELGKQTVSAATRSDSYLSFQNSISSSRASSAARVQPNDLSKRLRFGARILSRRGRDSARELCGFYFVGDSTMTIYEFRQFGQRSSALPFLQRRPYKHLFGELRDEQVLVGDIFSGLTLCFSTANQPSLPDSLKRYSRLYMRITQVDEKSQQELKAYINGEELRQRRSLLQSTEEITRSIQNSIWRALSKRSPKSLINLGRYFLMMDASNSGYLSKGQLLQALKTFHVSLSPEEFQAVWDLSAGMDAGGKVSHEQFRRLLLGGLPDKRRAVIRQVLVKLDANKTGDIQMWQMKKFFTSRRHPDVLGGKLTEEECYSDFFSAFVNDKFKTPDVVSYAELEDYYEFVSQTVPHDATFESILKNCWSV